VTIWGIEMNREQEAAEIIFDMIILFEMWRNGIFKDLGIEWESDPPAIIKAKGWLVSKKINAVASQPNQLRPE
jgi:hypothetical protein